jgi:hypothetical protein
VRFAARSVCAEQGWLDTASKTAKHASMRQPSAPARRLPAPLGLVMVSIVTLPSGGHIPAQLKRKRRRQELTLYQSNSFDTSTE